MCRAQPAPLAWALPKSMLSNVFGSGRGRRSLVHHGCTDTRPIEAVIVLDAPYRGPSCWIAVDVARNVAGSINAKEVALDASIPPWSCLAPERMSNGNGNG